MQIVIDIPEHIYEHAKETTEDSRDEFDAMRAIANGTQQESGSEIPNTCGDAISRRDALNAITMAEVRWQAVDNVNKLPSVTPQQRTGRWIPVWERVPEEKGTYLVTQKATFTDYVYMSVIGYALNLHDVDEYDFADKKRSGWYEYDSEWGYRELDDVIAWMPLPTPFRAESEVQE